MWFTGLPGAGTGSLRREAQAMVQAASHPPMAEDSTSWKDLEALGLGTCRAGHHQLLSSVYPSLGHLQSELSGQSGGVGLGWGAAAGTGLSLSSDSALSWAP